MPLDFSSLALSLARFIYPLCCTRQSLQRRVKLDGKRILFPLAGVKSAREHILWHRLHFRPATASRMVETFECANASPSISALSRCCYLNSSWNGL